MLSHSIVVLVSCFALSQLDVVPPSNAGGGNQLFIFGLQSLVGPEAVGEHLTNPLLTDLRILADETEIVDLIQQTLDFTEADVPEEIWAMDEAKQLASHGFNRNVVAEVLSAYKLFASLSLRNRQAPSAANLQAMMDAYLHLGLVWNSASETNSRSAGVRSGNGEEESNALSPLSTLTGRAASAAANELSMSLKDNAVVNVNVFHLGNTSVARLLASMVGREAPSGST